MASAPDPLRRFQDIIDEVKSEPDSAHASGRASGQPPVAARRTRSRAASVQAKKRWTIPPKARQYFPYVVVFLAILTPLLHDPPRNNTMPSQLIGIWRSVTPGYEDRYLRFTDRNLIFGTGGYDGEVYIVAEVQAAPADGEEQGGAERRTLIAIRYMKADRVEYEMSFYYEPKPVETITFKNQEHLKWTKKGPDA